MSTRLIYSAAVLLGALLLGGCSSKSEYYALQPALGPQSGTRHLDSRHIVGIGEVQVADYLQKNEIVTQDTASRYRVHTTAYWTGSLAKNIQRVLQENLTRLRPGTTFLRYPWEEPVSDRARLYLSIDRFDGDANGTVTLAGHWSLVDPRSDRFLSGERFDYRQKGAPGLAGIVATQSRLLDRLSRRIAAKGRRYF